MKSRHLEKIIKFFFVFRELLFKTQRNLNLNLKEVKKRN